MRARVSDFRWILGERRWNCCQVLWDPGEPMLAGAGRVITADRGRAMEGRSLVVFV